MISGHSKTIFFDYAYVCCSVYIHFFILKRMSIPLQTLCRHFPVFRDVKSNMFADLLLHIHIVALRNRLKAQANRRCTHPFFLHQDENDFSFETFIFLEFYIFRANILQTHLMPICCIKFLLIN